MTRLRWNKIGPGEYRAHAENVYYRAIKLKGKWWSLDYAIEGPDGRILWSLINYHDSMREAKFFAASREGVSA